MAFVSYDSYKNRIEKLAKFKNFVVKYKFLIMGVLAVIIGGVSALMATKGMITEDIVLADTFTYGQSYAPTAASAFLSGVEYEYSLQGSDEWTDKKPVKVGKYSGEPLAGYSRLAGQFPYDYYTPAVAWADATGLLEDTGAAFDPGSMSPRANIVTYLYRSAGKLPEGSPMSPTTAV